MVMRARFSLVVAVAVVILGVVDVVPAQEPCPPDEVWVEVTGCGVLVHHDNALFNCCPTWEHEIVSSGSLIDIFEHEILAQCYCVCCFDLIHVLHGLAPGTYTVRVWGAYGCEDTPCGIVDFTVPGGGDGLLSSMTVASGCGGWGNLQLIFADGFESGDVSVW
jgi:hypothetical protein